MKKIIYALIGIIIIMALALSIYSPSLIEKESYDKLNIIVSVLPQKAFVEAIGGDLVNVQELIPQGGSPSTYEPKPSDLVSVEKADIYFKIGYIPFEKSHMEKFIELNPNMKIVDTSTNVKLLYFGEEGNQEYEEIDPHIWLSPVQVKEQVEIITQTLIEEDPDNAEIYLNNSENFKKELDDLHSEIQSEFEKLKINKLMVFHPAWGYFADEYGLEQIAIEDSGKEPTAQDLKDTIEEANTDNIKVIFVQSQFDENVANSIAEEIGAIVISIDPLSEDYINNLKNVARVISEGLNK